MNRLEGRVAIITGGGAGLGKAYAKVFCHEGAKVAIFEYSEQSGKATEEELREQGYEVTFFKCDVSDEEVVRAAVKIVAEKYGQIDILVNNAQATDRNSLPTAVEDTTLELMKLCWTTGALGTFFCTKAVVPYMKRQEYGRIINTGSAAGLNGLPTFTAYGSQKEAIRSMTKVWARELGNFGITSNVIMPGAMTEASKLWKEADPAGYEEAVKPQPIPRLGDPETDIAPLVLFLASEEARFITGQTIGADGGTSMY